MAYVSNIAVDSSSYDIVGKVPLYTCSAAATAQIKTVSGSDLLPPGAMIAVWFSNKHNSSSSPARLKIGAMTAQNIVHKGVNIYEYNSWPEGSIVTMINQDSVWNIVNMTPSKNWDDFYLLTNGTTFSAGTTPYTAKVENDVLVLKEGTAPSLNKDLVEATIPGTVVANPGILNP